MGRDMGLRKRPRHRSPSGCLVPTELTGNMDDEIERIKETLLFISVRISGPPSQPDQRFGMVVYRDRGDEFVTRIYGFQKDS